MARPDFPMTILEFQQRFGTEETRLPLRTWFWAVKRRGHTLRAAMVAPERELLKGEVEIDEFFLGGYEEGLKGGRQHGKKTLVAAAIEVCGRGSGRLRLQLLPNSQASTLEAFHAGDDRAWGDRAHRRALLL